MHTHTAGTQRHAHTHTLQAHIHTARAHTHRHTCFKNCLLPLEWGKFEVNFIVTCAKANFLNTFYFVGKVNSFKLMILV